MDNADVYDIPINSPLEPSLEDAIVNVQRPTFSYNPQAPVSGFLSNSIKYEGDGIFADWYRYDYRVLYTHVIKYNSDELDPFPQPQILEDEIIRNFWFYEDVPYALHVSFPWTQYLKNLEFTAGFGDILEDQTKVGDVVDPMVERLPDSTNLVDVLAPTASTYYPSENPVPGEMYEKYIITGSTYKWGNTTINPDNPQDYMFRLLVDPYTRLMEEYQEDGNDSWPAYVPNDYEAFMDFGQDVITATVLRKLKDEDNLVMVYPLLIEHNVANDLSISRVEKENGITTLTFADGESNIQLQDDHTDPILSNHLGLDPLGYVVNPDVVDTVNESVEITVQNPSSTQVDLMVSVKEAITQVNPLARRPYRLAVTPALTDRAKALSLPQPSVVLGAYEAGRQDWPTIDNQPYLDGVLHLSGQFSSSFMIVTALDNLSFNGIDGFIQKVVITQNAVNEDSGINTPFYAWNQNYLSNGRAYRMSVRSDSRCEIKDIDKYGRDSLKVVKIFDDMLVPEQGISGNNFHWGWDDVRLSAFESGYYPKSTNSICLKTSITSVAKTLWPIYYCPNYTFRFTTASISDDDSPPYEKDGFVYPMKNREVAVIFNGIFPYYKGTTADIQWGSGDSAIWNRCAFVPGASYQRGSQGPTDFQPITGKEFIFKSSLIENMDSVNDGSIDPDFHFKLEVSGDDVYIYQMRAYTWEKIEDDGVTITPKTGYLTRRVRAATINRTDPYSITNYGRIRLVLNGEQLDPGSPPDNGLFVSGSQWFPRLATATGVTTASTVITITAALPWDCWRVDDDSKNDGFIEEEEDSRNFVNSGLIYEDIGEGSFYKYFENDYGNEGLDLQSIDLYHWYNFRFNVDDLFKDIFSETMNDNDEPYFTSNNYIEEDKLLRFDYTFKYPENMWYRPDQISWGLDNAGSYWGNRVSFEGGPNYLFNQVGTAAETIQDPNNSQFIAYGSGIELDTAVYKQISLQKIQGLQNVQFTHWASISWGSGIPFYGVSYAHKAIVNLAIKGNESVGFTLRCHEVESGDWSLDVTSESSLMELKNIEMNEDLTGGIINVSFTQVRQQKSSGQELGITFDFIPRKFLYIDEIAFRSSNKNIMQIPLGRVQEVGVEAVFQPWDFLNTLTNAGGTLIPMLPGQSVQYALDDHEQDMFFNFSGVSPSEIATYLTTINQATLGRPGRTEVTYRAGGYSFDMQMGNIGVVTRESVERPARWILPGLSDATERFIKLRRMFMLPPSGMVSDYEFISANGSPDVMDMVFKDSRDDEFIIQLLNGVYAYKQESDEIEIGNTTDYVRSVGEYPVSVEELDLIDDVRNAEIDEDDESSEELQLQLDEEYNKSPYNVSENGSVVRFLFRDSDKGVITFLPKGIYQRASEDIKYIGLIATDTDVDVQFEYMPRTEYDKEEELREPKTSSVTVEFDGEAYIRCLAHDLRTGDKKALSLSSPKDDFAVLTTQFDSDAATENFWYIDQDHILQLTADSLILLERNTDLSYIDTDGERKPKSSKDGGYWEQIKSRPREEIFGSRSDGFKYGVTCAVEELPYLYVIEPIDTGIKIRYVSTRTTDLLFEEQITNQFSPTWNEKTFKFTTVERNGFSSSTLSFIGQPPVPSFFVNNIEVTSTLYEGTVLLGIRYDRGVHQWTLVLKSRPFVFNGYGCVGIDGTVTGGAIPAYAMNMRQGMRVSLRDKPELSAAMTQKKRAFISGQSLCFVDDVFNGGICVGAKFDGNQFRLKNLPLRFSRYKASESAKGSGIDTRVKGEFIFPNPLVVFLATAWVWARTTSAAVLNYWSVNMMTEDEDYYEDEQKAERVAGMINNTLYRVALALMANTATATSIAADKLGNVMDRIVNDSSSNRKDRWNGVREGETQEEKSQRRKDAWKKVWQEPEWDSQEEKESAKLGRISMNRKYYRDKIAEGIMAMFNASNSGMHSQPRALSVAKSRLGLSGVYSISANQNVFAGPGFTQIQFVQGSRISGSYSNSHGAQGGGSQLGIRIPPIPIPFVGPLDINNTGLVGVQPVQGVNTFDVKMEYQPNVNVGSKHMVYSYPTQDIHSHIINQTELMPVTQPEMVELYKDEGFPITRNYEKRILKFATQTKRTEFYDNCSLVQGVDSFFAEDSLLDLPVKIDTGYPVFSEPGLFDFCVYPSAQLFYSAIAGEIFGVSVRDTLILDGAPSNVVIKNEVPLVASTYTCVEVTNEISNDTLFPRVFSGDTVLFNTTGYNTIKKLGTYHGFDGYTNRIAKLTGEVGVDAEVQNSVFSHVAQDAFKTAALPPPTSYFGKFTAVPELDTYLHKVQIYSRYLGNMGRSPENLQGYRYSIPIVHNNVAILPAAVQGIATYKAHVIDGITSLTTDLRTTNPRAKKPIAHDFVIYGQAYRANAEYISRVNASMGTISLQDVVATLGLTYLGSTPKIAWFYSPTIHAFYTFTGSDTLEKVNTAFRFKDVVSGTWDFVSQEVAFRTIMENRLTIIRVDQDFIGQVYPPNKNVMSLPYINSNNDKISADFKYYGLASGLALQGPRRGQINRFVLQENMFREGEHPLDGPNDGIPMNERTGKFFTHWFKPENNKLNDFWEERDYDWGNSRVNPINGYYIEPFKLATSFLGVDENKECQFEWEISFALTDLMKKILRDRYVTVNLASELQTVGGFKQSEVTRLYLKEDLFDRRSGSSGYYNFRFNGRNGAGNSEKLFIWSDGIVSIRQLKVHVSVISEARTAPLVTRPDVQNIEEM